MADLKKLLAIKDSDGKFVLSADEVAKITGKKRNAVYESRKNDCKLDKLAIFEKIKEEIEEYDKNKTVIAGDKNCILKGLHGVLMDNKIYKIEVIV